MGQRRGYIVDGYSFKGKKSFQKALDGLKDLMKKGAVGEVNEIKFKVLDTRTNGAGLDVEIEMASNNSRGIAVLKLYGPSTKKQNVVMVTKSRESDSKFVIMLAEEVIKPLMIKFLGGEDDQTNTQTGVKRTISVGGKEMRLVKCPHCDKTSYSVPGLKGHITKMHKSDEAIKTDKRAIKVRINNGSYKEEGHIFNEANKVIDLLMDDVIDLSD